MADYFERDKLPTAQKLRMLHATLTYKQIAEHYGVTEQAVQKKLALDGYGPKAEAHRRSQLVPFDVDTKAGHGKMMASVNLRSHLAYRDGEALDGLVLKRLEGFWRRLADQVLTYDREKGWRMVPRAPEDEDLVIRWPTGVDRLAKGDMDLFRLPNDAEGT